jgi:hypothetical protein
MPTSLSQLLPTKLQPVSSGRGASPFAAGTKVPTPGATSPGHRYGRLLLTLHREQQREHNAVKRDWTTMHRPGSNALVEPNGWTSSDELGKGRGHALDAQVRSCTCVPLGRVGCGNSRSATERWLGLWATLKRMSHAEDDDHTRFLRLEEPATPTARRPSCRWLPSSTKWETIMTVSRPDTRRWSGSAATA